MCLPGVTALAALFTRKWANRAVLVLNILIQCRVIHKNGCRSAIGTALQIHITPNLNRSGIHKAIVVREVVHNNVANSTHRQNIFYAMIDRQRQQSGYKKLVEDVIDTKWDALSASRKTGRC